MTDHLRALRVLHARTPVGDERDALQAAIRMMEVGPVRDRALLHAGRYHLAYVAGAEPFAEPSDFEVEVIGTVDDDLSMWLANR